MSWRSLQLQIVVSTQKIYMAVQAKFSESNNLTRQSVLESVKSKSLPHEDTCKCTTLRYNSMKARNIWTSETAIGHNGSPK